MFSPIVHACVLSLQGLPAGLSVGFGHLQQTDERIQEELQTGTFLLSCYLKEGQMYFSSSFHYSYCTTPVALNWPDTVFLWGLTDSKPNSIHTEHESRRSFQAPFNLMQTRQNRQGVKLKIIITQYTLNTGTLSIWKCWNLVNCWC